MPRYNMTDYWDFLPSTMATNHAVDVSFPPLVYSKGECALIFLLVIVDWSDFLSDGAVALQQHRVHRGQAATFQSGCWLSFLSHLNPIGAASSSEGGTHINSQAAVTTLRSTVWMLFHSFAVPLLHCQLRYGVWCCCSFTPPPRPSTPPLSLWSLGCGVTDAWTLNAPRMQLCSHLWKVWVEWGQYWNTGWVVGELMVACVGWSLWAEQGKCSILVS